MSKDDPEFEINLKQRTIDNNSVITETNIYIKANNRKDCEEMYDKVKNDIK